MGQTVEKDEEYWIEQFYNGNDQALAYFFKEHSKSLAYFSGRIIQDKDEAEDIVSKCFMKLWQRRDEIKSIQNIKGFLFVSCRNACLDYIDSLKVRTRVQENYLTHLQNGQDTIFYDIVQSDVLDLVNKEIQELPEKMRQIFKMLYTDGKTTSEIAEELGLSVQTVRNQKTKAVDLIKNSLVKKGVSTALQLAFLFYIGGK